MITSSPRDSDRWSTQQNKRFENAIALFDKDSPERWDNIAHYVGGKTPVDVKRHYDLLLHDIRNIDCGLVSVPQYSHTSFVPSWVSSSASSISSSDQAEPSTSVSFSPPKTKPSYSARSSDQERKKGIPWTEEEHRLFLLGLNKYGKGDWRSISRNFVVSRTPTQVASHAQKYFLRLGSGNKEKKRSSIHDITSVAAGDVKQSSLQKSSALNSSTSSPTTTPPQTLLYPSSLASNMATPMISQSPGNQIMLPSSALSTYSPEQFDIHSFGHVMPNSSLRIPQMEFPLQPTMHNQ